ncbi:MAG: hypothetical protein LBR10_14050 [Prevotellaceae bacterium]|jgi:nicotinamidase-related amidase|nr:hypothetical protein [Prevotellaceae bacterium]
MYIIKNKALLLIIDAQYDFCDTKGALYVPGAENDMERLGAFIRNNEAMIENIVLSQDSHQVMDISHPAFWQNREGKNPSPFTSISVEDVEQGVWIPVIEKKRTLEYLKQLNEQGEFPHVIWPEHCIEGSRGASIADSVMREVENWSRSQQRCFTVVQKGKNPMTEHFGVFKANIPVDEDFGTQENRELLDLISRYSTIYIAGEAQSHCVATTVKQLLPYPAIAEKIIILKNCMSPVTGFEHLADSIYQQLNQHQFIEV